MGPINFETEYTPKEPQTDAIWVMDGRGQMIQVEVDDDVADD